MSEEQKPQSFRRSQWDGIVNIVPLEKEDLQKAPKPQQDLVSKKRQSVLKPMQSIMNQRRKSAAKDLKMMSNTMDYEMTFDKESDPGYNSQLMKKSNTRERLMLNEESSDKSLTSQNLRSLSNFQSQILVSDFEPGKLGPQLQPNKSNEERKKKEKRRPSKVQITAPQHLGQNLQLKKYQHKPSFIARQNSHRNVKMNQGGTIGENDSPLNKARNSNAFNRGKSFVKSPDSISRLSIQKQLKHQVSVRKSGKKKDEMLQSELQSIKNEMMSQMQKMQEIQNNLLGVPQSAKAAPQQQEEQYLSPTRLRPNNNSQMGSKQQTANLRHMRKMTIAMRNSIQSENQPVMNQLAQKAEKKEFKISLQKNRPDDSMESQQSETSSDASSFNIHGKRNPQISVQSSLSHSNMDELSKKGSLNKILPSSQNSISKASRNGPVEEESMATSRPLLQLSNNNLQNTQYENYKFQTADSQEQLVNTQDPTAQPTEGRPSMLRMKSTQKSGQLQNSFPQSPLAKSNNDKLRPKKPGKFGKQRNFKHKAAELYAMGNSQRDLLQPDYFIVLPDDMLKIIWDTIMLIFIIFTSIMTPYQISFHNNDMNLGMLTYNYVVDVLFCLDIVINFYMAYYDDNHELVIDRKIIASHYLRGWFFYDLASISSLLMLVPGMDSSSWLKFFRIVRVLRIAKLVKDNPTMAKLFQDTLKVSSGVERLFFFLIAVLIFTHFMACLWYFQADQWGGDQNTWVIDSNLEDSPKFDLYIASMYFILATLTTVGYGDVAAFNTVERVLCIIIMSFGVFVFSFSIGSLSSVLTSMDNNLAKFKEKQKILKIMKKQHNIPFVLEDKILKALRYDFKKSNQDKSEFLNSLPTNLKTELALVMHQKVIEDIAWLQQKEDQFVSAAAPRFKAIRFNAGDILFKEGNPNEDIFFIISGKVAFVLPEYNDLVYVTLERGEYVGDIDFAANKDKGIRLFTVKALQRTEAYFLNVSDLHHLELYFQEIMLEFFDNAEIRYKQAKRIRAKAEKHIIKQSEAIIQHQVQKAIMKAKQQNQRSSLTKMPMIEDERVVENFTARKGLGGQLAKIKNSEKDSIDIESADSFKTSSSSEIKSKETSTFKSDSSFVEEDESGEQGLEGNKKPSFQGSSDIEAESEEDDQVEEKKIEPMNLTRRGSTQRLSAFGGFGSLKIRDLNDSQKIVEEDESNYSDITSIKKSKKGFGKKSNLGKSKTGKTSNSYEDGSPSNGQSPNQIPKITQILKKESSQMSPNRNSLTVPTQQNRLMHSEFQEIQSPGLRRQSVNQVRERKSKLGNMYASHSPVGSSLQSSILETNSPLPPQQPQSNTPAAVPFSIGAVNLPRKYSIEQQPKLSARKESSSKEEKEVKDDKIIEEEEEHKEESKHELTPRDSPQFKIKIHQAESPTEKLDLAKLTENSDNELNLPQSRTSKHTKRSNNSLDSERKLKKKLLSTRDKLNSQELDNSSSAQEENKKSTFFNKKEIQRSSMKRRTSMAASTEVLNGLSALIASQQQKAMQKPELRKDRSIERRNTHKNFEFSSFAALEGAKSSKNKRKHDRDETRSNGFLNSQRSLKVIKTTVGGTAQVSHFGVINSTAEHNPIIETMAKKIEDLKRKAKQKTYASGSDNEKFNSDIKKDIKDMMKQNQEQTAVQNQLNLQILHTLKKLTEQVEMQSESMGTNLVNKSMGSNGEFLVDSDNEKGPPRSSQQSSSSRQIKLSSSVRGVKKQQRSNLDTPKITVSEVPRPNEDSTRNEETGDVKKRLSVSARPENRDQL